MRGYDKEILYQNLDQYLKLIPDLKNVINKDNFLWNNRNFLKRLKEKLLQTASDKNLALWDNMAKEISDEQKISDLYGGHDWAFDCMLVETEHSSVRYLIATVLALAFDKEVRKQGNTFMQEDIDLWRDVSKLTVEEFAERLTGQTCTKQMWAEIIEESLLEPMRRYIKAMEALTG